MLTYVLRRLLAAIPTLFIVVTLAFFLMRVAPGGPFDSERPLSADVIANIRRVYRLDEPLWQQYASYLWNLAHGDLGPSFTLRDFTVSSLFAHALPISIELGGLALLFAVGVGGAVGIVAAWRRGQTTDHLGMAAATLGLTIPNFVVAPLLQVVFGLTLAILPIGGWSNGDFSHLVLPVLTLALPQTAAVARLTRGAMVEALRSNHVRTLRAYGLPTRTILGHALRGAALPVVSYLGPAAAALLTGSIVVETIFSLPGVGRYFVDGALNRDYTLVMGTVVLIASLVILLNLLVDVAYALLDPRVRYD